MQMDNLSVGSPDVKPSASAHTAGVREGNKRKIFASHPGIRTVGLMAVATPRRSTGINPNGRAPIDPRMPTLTPA